MSNILKYFISTILRHFETEVLYLGEKTFLNYAFFIQFFDSLYVIDTNLGDPDPHSWNTVVVIGINNNTCAL